MKTGIQIILTCLLIIPTLANSAVVTTLVTAPANFEDISVAPDGTIYMPSPPGGHVIYKVTPEGELTTHAHTPGFPQGGAVAADGTLYMSLWSLNQIYKINPDGSTISVLGSIAGPTGICPSNDPNILFIVSYTWGALYEYDRTTQVKTLLVNGPELVGPDGLAVDENDNIYMANFLDTRIHKRSPDGVISLLCTLPGSQTGYIDYRDGMLYVAGLSSNVVYIVDVADGSFEILAGTGVAGSHDGPAHEATFNGINGLALSPDGQLLYVGESGRLRQIDLREVAPVADGLQSPKILLGATPNPFNPRTSIKFNLPESDSVRLSIHDLRGHQVRVLQDGNMASGHHSLQWNGQDFNGRAVASGTYLIRLETSSKTESKTMTLAR